MLSEVFSFWIGLISTCINFLFSLKINENPDITIGTFLLSFAFIGAVIYFIFGSDFFPGHINLNSNNNNNSNNGYQPKHARKE